MKNYLDCNVKKISNTCYQVDNGIAVYYYLNETCSTLHRDNGPAIEFKSGEVHYYLHGMRHNLAGPAVVFEQTKQYWINDEQCSIEEFEKLKQKFERKLQKNVPTSS